MWVHKITQTEKQLIDKQIQLDGDAGPKLVIVEGELLIVGLLQKT